MGLLTQVVRNLSQKPTASAQDFCEFLVDLVHPGAGKGVMLQGWVLVAGTDADVSMDHDGLRRTDFPARYHADSMGFGSQGFRSSDKLTGGRVSRTLSRTFLPSESEFTITKDCVHIYAQVV